MATRIGDEGMVLPNAPKLMFDEALKLKGGLSEHITLLLKTSFNISLDLDDQAASKAAEEQMPLIEEWQEVMTKTRLISKLDIKECVEKHMPIPFLASIKAVRDLLPARPIATTLQNIEKFPALIERFNEWESSRLTMLEEMVAAFSASTETGEMTDKRYVDMHIAFAAAYVFKHRFRPSSLLPAGSSIYDREARKWASVDEMLSVLQDEDATEGYIGVNRATQAKVFQRISSGDVELAIRHQDQFFDKEASSALKDQALAIVSLGSGRWTSMALLRRAQKQLDKLNSVRSELPSEGTASTFERALICGKFKSGRGGRKYYGICDLVGMNLQDGHADARLLHRPSVSLAMLGVKPSSRTDANREHEEAEQELPEGTPVDESNQPLPQPRKPERNDLSSEIAELDDVELDDSDEATYEDFRYLVDDYGFRGLQIGNYVPQKMRRYLTGAIHQSVNDLADALQIPPTLVALGNPLPEALKNTDEVSHQSYPGMSMGLALGARGRGNAAAHYEPGGSEKNNTKRHIINLTRDKGAGSFCHEVGHGIDYTLAELCDFDKALSQINDKTISRVTGHPAGRRVGAVSEAWAVFWTMATNRHIQRGDAMPNKENMRSFAMDMLKDEYSSEPAYIEMVMGIGFAMKQAYARELTPKELLSRHAHAFCSELAHAVQNTEQLLVGFAQEAFDTLDPGIAKAELATREMWFLPDIDSREGINALADMKRTSILDASKLAGNIAAKLIERSTNREPHASTREAFENLMGYRISYARAAARLMREGISNGHFWATEQGHQKIKAALQGKDNEHVDVFDKKAMPSIALATANLLATKSTSWDVGVSRLIDILEAEGHSLKYGIETLQRELFSPTPHEMEVALSQPPKTIHLTDIERQTTPANLAGLESPHNANTLHSLVEGISALIKHLEQEGQSISAERLALHPRLMQRIAVDMNHRLTYMLERIFEKEEEVMTFLGIDGDEGGRIHPAMPSAVARAKLEEPDMLARLYAEGVDRHSSRPPFDRPFDASGYLSITSVFRDQLDGVLSTPDRARGFVQLIGLMQSIEADYARPAAKAGRNRDKGDELATAELEEAYAKYSPSLKAFMERDGYFDNAYANDLNEFKRDFYSGIHQAFGSMNDDLVSIPYTISTAGKKIAQAGAGVNQLITAWVRRGYADKSWHRVNEKNTAVRYFEGLKSFAASINELATSFAYMTDTEREDALTKAIGHPDTAPSTTDIEQIYQDGLMSFTSHTHPMTKPENPEFETWCQQHFAMVTASLHIKEFTSAEKDLLSYMQNDYRRWLPKTIAQHETSRMLRASAKYENRSIARNGYLEGERLKYWATPVEVFARSFETFVNDLIEAQGRESRYLVTVANPERQDRQLDALEALVASRVLTLPHVCLDLERFERELFQRYRPDYSLNYPTGIERLENEKAFAPLVASLAPGLSQRFPEAIALHEQNLANNVYQRKKEVLSPIAHAHLETKPRASNDVQPDLKKGNIVDVAVPASTEQSRVVESTMLDLHVAVEEEHEMVATHSHLEVSPDAESDASNDNQGLPHNSEKADCSSPREQAQEELEDLPLHIPPALRSAMEDVVGATEQDGSEEADGLAAVEHEGDGPVTPSSGLVPGSRPTKSPYTPSFNF